MGGDFPQRHLLDKRDIHIVIHRKARQIQYFVVIKAGQNHRIKFNALKANRTRGFNTGQHLMQIAHPSQGFKSLRFKAIDADINARQACIF